MTGVEVLVAVSIAVGVVGVVVPLLPGALLVWLAIVVWGITVGPPPAGPSWPWRPQ